MFAAARRIAVTLATRRHTLAAVPASSSFSSVSDNALLDRAAPFPRFSAVRPEDVCPAVDAGLAELATRWPLLEQNMTALRTGDAAPPASFLYNLSLGELERAQDPVLYAYSAVSHLTMCATTDELRSAFETVQPKVVLALSEQNQSRPLYDTLLALRNADDFEQLGRAQRRIVDAKLKDMELTGVGLEGEDQERFNAIQQELAQLSTEVSNNILDSTKAWAIDIPAGEAGAARLAGLPPSAMALAASLSGETGATAGAGPWRLTLDPPIAGPVLKHLRDRATREAVYRARLQIASTEPHDNSEHVLRILQLRQQMCDLLGFQNYAQVSLEKKMARSPEQVTQMFAELRDAAMPQAKEELEEVRRFAHDEDGLAPIDLKQWDYPYYAERLGERRFGYKEEDLKPYFPLDGVLTGLFDICGTLFGVDVELRSSGAGGRTARGGEAAAAACWHEDVRFYDVRDRATGETVAGFFLDPYMRPADKRAGAWMNPCVGRSANLGRSVPVAIVVCNGAPPVDGKPSLLTFRDVETLFHEMGHALQHMLTEVDEAPAAGINGVEWDAVELPSQFMENFCYHQESLLSFARHYETGELLPRDLFEKLRASRTFHSGMSLLTQIYHSQLDMFLHDGRIGEDATPQDVLDLQRQVAIDYLLLEPLTEDRFLNQFSHIFAGGYAAGYYRCVLHDGLLRVCLLC